jgi:DNA polymerase-3 subunit epsilon
VSVEFCVLDIETTGLFPGGSDRITEISVLRVEPNGTLVSQYSTLVNPQRDIGQSSLHGIWSRDVLDAPVIEEILGDVVAMLQGTVAVGHNVTFDLRFLGHEFERCDPPPDSLESY